MRQIKSAVVVGRVGAAYGIKGWVKLVSFTSPPENILEYAPWQLRRSADQKIVIEAKPLSAKAHGKGWVAKFAGVDDRDQAEALKGLEIVIDRDQLPEPEDGLYYWTDLEGMQVETISGVSLGKIDHMLEAGAADVMVVCDEANDRHLIPFIREEVVLAVDLKAGLIRVDWEIADNGEQA